MYRDGLVNGVLDSQLYTTMCKKVRILKHTSELDLRILCLDTFT